MTITLGEGNTALVRSRSIGPAAGIPNLYFKLESGNPTGSYKDRFAAAAVSHMVKQGQTMCLATSSGNTGAALAAYCAAAGIGCRIVVVETAPVAKLRQMLAYGAELIKVRRFGLDPAVMDGVFSHLNALASQPGRALQISAYRYSPVGMAGVESISHELSRQCPDVAHVFCQAGGGGLTLAVARGFQPGGPAIHCVQPAGNDTIAGPLRAGESQARAVTCTSQISGLQVGSVIDGDEVIAACRASGGTGHLVSDEAIWQTQKRLAREEGLFTEPAGATALAGALQAAAKGELDPRGAVVCLLTGSGFKDAGSLERMTAEVEIPLVDAEELSGW